MDLYHTFIYEKIFNAPWFILSFVFIVILLNFLGPVIVWFIMNSKPMPILRHLKKKKS
ncbi:hypothetical protein ABE096_11855 [Robertmurraya massiliosenegalensis]|uniref:hypothetical protein n=1 Tax=Robertmurraya TaxID=2837507 RepID=UPI0039A5711B